MREMEFLTVEHGSLFWEKDLCRRWSDAAALSGQLDPFSCTPAWQMAFHDAFAPHRRLLITEEEGSVLAFAEHRYPSGVVCLTPVESHWLSCAPLMGEHGIELFLRFLKVCAVEYRPYFPTIVLSALPDFPPFFRSLDQAISNVFRFDLYHSSEQRSASLSGGMDGYLSRRSGNFRCKMKKARRRALEKGVSFERFSPVTIEDADIVYNRMIAVEEKSWKGLGHCGMTETPSREFYHTMIQRMALYGASRVMFATCEGKDIGFIFGGMAGNVYRGQQFSFDSSWKAYSIGDLLQLEQIAWLSEEEADRYDMGMSDDPRMAYKRHWAEGIQTFQTWLMRPR